MATTKIDLSEFYALSRPKKPPCQIGFVLEQLAPDQAEQLRAALATDGGIITAASIVAWLAKRDHESNPSRVTNHRRGVCSCGKP